MMGTQVLEWEAELSLESCNFTSALSYLVDLKFPHL